jgi:glucokinase
VILAGDVGATKILLELGELRSGRWDTALARRYSTAEAESFSSVLAAFLGEWNRRRSRSDRITAAGFGVAGPREGNRVKMTHRPRSVDGSRISSEFLIPAARVVNDLEACAHGIAWLGARDCAVIQPGKAYPEDPAVVLGVGTGLGVAYLVPDGEAGRVVPGEGGHAGFAPASVAQAALWHSITASHGRCSAEDVVSGRGLVNVFAHVRGTGGHPRCGLEEPVLAEHITKHAEDEAECAAALDLFVECLGTVAGDLALAAMARGGVYIAGGVAAQLVERIREGRFREAFCAKGPMSAMMMRIPVRVVKSARVGVLGAARVAAAGAR